ncbi:MAG: hypothetical protein ACOYOE_11545 [Chlorobium sp.]
MDDSKKIEQGFIIDRLTNSILNTVSGDSFQTEVIRLSKSDLKYITKNKGWNFNWKQEFDEIKKEVYKLTIVNNPNIIQGLLKIMGLIKEPEGVDFIIQSPPLTDIERKEISEFIRIRKLQNKTKLKQTISKKRMGNNVTEMPNP